MLPDPRERDGEAVPANDEAQPTTPAPSEPTESEDEPEEQQDTESESEDEPTPPPSQAQAEATSREQRRRARDAQKIERLEREVKEMRSRAGYQLGDIKAEVDRRAGAPPKETDYRGDFLEYDRDLTVYKLKRELIQQQVSELASRQQEIRHQQLREAAETHQDRVFDFKEKTPDYDVVMERAKAEGLQVSPVVEDLLLESDHSAQLQYYFAKHPDALEQVNGMTERQAARAIGNLEAHISVPSNRNRQQTRAPAPLRPLTGGAAPASPDRDLDAYISRKYGKR